VTIFVDAPVEELERRLRERATESSGEIEERIALAREQQRARRVRLRRRERRPRAAPTSSRRSSQRSSRAATMAPP
jgi:predicted ATPase with chaperone activity